jgi:hypothetical protein
VAQRIAIRNQHARLMRLLLPRPHQQPQRLYHLCIRQHTSASVSIRHTRLACAPHCGCCCLARANSPSAFPNCRQHTPAYVSIRQQTSAYVSRRQHTSAYVSIRQHTSAYVSKRQHMPAYVSIRQHTSAHVSIRHHTWRTRENT